ncbi:Lysoplasmalogenase-like protein TMEM86A [Armadillidium vulgare]|nr:Lysoplasmalogenase-like protein TMEM86A [Armadillidium vulgare]
MCSLGKHKSILPYIISSIIAVFFVAPYEANGSFSIVAVTIKMFPIFYLILYMNSYLDSTYSTMFTSIGKEKDNVWIDKHQLATGVVCGLVCSIIGDFILLVRFKDESFFILGTGAFAVAQLCYIHAFGFHSKQLKVGLSLYGVCSVLSFFVLREASLSLKLFLSVYGFLLVTSLWRAIDRINYEDGRKQYQKILLPIGLLSFLFSDLWIGVSTFLLKENQTSSVQFILFTYYLAQGLIAVSSS